MSPTASPCLLGSRLCSRRCRLAAAVGRARGPVTEAVGSWGIGVGLGNAVLLTSELTASATQADPGRTVMLGIICRVGRLYVYDEAPALPAPAESAPGAETERGLCLVSVLAADWGTNPTPEGKAVYFTLALRPGPGGDAWPRQQAGDAEAWTAPAALAGGCDARRCNCAGPVRRPSGTR